MPDYIGDALQPKVIRVTRGADRKFTLRRKDTDGNPVNWDAQVYMSLDIGRTPTRVDAQVTGPDAVFQIEAEVLDLAKSANTWQAIVSQPGSPSLETPLMVGTFLRQDGSARG